MLVFTLICKQVDLFTYLLKSLTYLISFLRIAQEYFTYTTLASIMVGENPAVSVTTHDHSQLGVGRF